MRNAIMGNHLNCAGAKRHRRNRPFYSSVTCNQASVWKRGLGWPWHDRDQKLVSIRIKGFAYQKQEGLYKYKVTLSLTSTQRLGT